MLYFHAVRGADTGAKINNLRGAVRTRQNIPKPHRVRAVDISSAAARRKFTFSIWKHVHGPPARPARQPSN